MNNKTTCGQPPLINKYDHTTTSDTTFYAIKEKDTNEHRTVILTQGAADAMKKLQERHYRLWTAGMIIETALRCCLNKLEGD